MAEARLSKIMAQRGLCSRREADRYIELGLVEVNGERISVLGFKTDEEADIRLLSAAQEQQDRLATVLLNKPIGYVSNLPEDGHQAASELITPENHIGAGSKRLNPHGLAPAGRLDIDSQGLLILTQDGRVARQIIGENSQIEKEYLIWVNQEATEAQLELLRFGLSLDGKALKLAKIKRMDTHHIQFILQEGKKRQIRRMCELVDLHVVRLMRVRVGQVRLEDLPVGKWRYLKPEEQF